jgi:hypothetical protein
MDCFPSTLDGPIQAPRSAADPDLSRIGAGERQAILLAHEHQPALLVTDDRRARRVAEARGLRVVGTIWGLERAAERGLVDLPSTLTRLLATNIRLHPDIIQNALTRDLVMISLPLVFARVWGPCESLKFAVMLTPWTV